MNFISKRGSPSRYSTFSRRSRDLDERVAHVVLRDLLACAAAALWNRNSRAPGVGRRET